MEIKTRVGINLLKSASVYMIVSLGLGLGMGMAHDHTLSTAHSHLALLGWVTMALTGLVYLAVPACAGSPLARWHYWPHSIGLPILIVSLGLQQYGHAVAEQGTALGSIVVLLALTVFTINVFRNLRAG